MAVLRRRLRTGDDLRSAPQLGQFTSISKIRLNSLAQLMHGGSPYL